MAWLCRLPCKWVFGVGEALTPPLPGLQGVTVGSECSIAAVQCHYALAVSELPVCWLYNGKYTV